MRIAIFGLGSIGKRHAANLIEMGETELMVYDPDVLKIVQVPPMPHVAVIADEKLLWDWKPEAVLVCTPPNMHHTFAWRALMSGCHVFVEKPLAQFTDNANALCRAARLEGHVLAVGYQLRWQLEAFRKEASGADHVVYLCSQDMAAWPSCYDKEALEEFSHELDAAQYVRGPVEAVMAKQFGSVWNINLRHLRGYSYVRLDSAGPMLREAMTKDARWTFDRAKNEQAYKDELAAFLTVCRGGPWDERLCSGAEAAHVCRIIEACRESARECKVVSLS